MPFDAELMLINGSIEITAALDYPAILTTKLEATGARVLDIKETGVRGLAAVLICPTEDVTNYDQTLTAKIQHSDTPEGNWEDLANFPVLTNFLVKIPAVADVNPALEAAFGEIVTGGGDGNDTGLIWHLSPELFTLDGEGWVTVSQSDALALWDDAAAQTLISATAGNFSGHTRVVAATATAAAVTPKQPMPGLYVQRFATDKRYIRAHVTVVGDLFGKVQVLVTPYPFKTL